MVLRKQIPPRLDSPAKGSDRFESNTSTSPSASTSSTSPRRLARKQARSSSQSHRSPGGSQSPQVPSQESIFSPDLNTSPAFDLMPLEQAQRSPVSASYSEPKNPWNDDSVEAPHQDSGAQSEQRTQNNPDSNNREGEVEAGAGIPTQIPSVLVPSRQSAHSTGEASGRELPDLPSVQLQSNNPFLKNGQSEEDPWGNHQPPAGRSGTDDAHWRDSRTTQQSDPLSQSMHCPSL